MLDERPARILTSREVSKIIGSLLGGFVEWGIAKETLKQSLLFWLDNLETLYKVLPK